MRSMTLSMYNAFFFSKIATAGKTLEKISMISLAKNTLPSTVCILGLIAQF